MQKCEQGTRDIDLGTVATEGLNQCFAACGSRLSMVRGKMLV